MKILLVLCVFIGIIRHNYSYDFALRYGEDQGYNSYVYLVIPRNSGYIIVENALFKEFEYRSYPNKYESYSSFLYEVLNNKSIPLYHNWSVYDIPKFASMPKKWLGCFMQKYFRIDENGTMLFKKRLSRDKEHLIIKLMFDSGYFVGWRDYQAEWFFIQELSPMPPPIPEE